MHREGGETARVSNNWRIHVLHGLEEQKGSTADPRINLCINAVYRISRQWAPTTT